ncbi:hypothetical protein Cpir12675_002583 [Ceratocystis pirilliformis]|uniref:Phytase A n=1 Tax=Ceratocystis pirilliformis TaxID=259994 RepID=A0ABR3Z8E4_9PEZI
MNVITSAYGAVQSALTARQFQYQPIGGNRRRGVFYMLRASGSRRKVQFTMAAMAALLVGAIVVGLSSSACFECLFAVNPSLWGQYSPMFSVPTDISTAVPDQCKLTFGHVLSRHGARDPTMSKTKALNATIQRIHDDVLTYGPGYEFIRNYTYSLGADQLTDFGQRELFLSGAHFFNRYLSLAENSVPYIRASGQDRVIMSAVNWTQGFYDARMNKGIESPEKSRGTMLIIEENSTSNNTLNNNLCTAFENGTYSTIGDKAQAEFLATFIEPVTARLNANLPGANLNNDEAIQMMDMCPYSTVASRNATISEFCDLFTIGEWLSYDYYQSLNKYYGFSHGNEMAATAGVGWVNELIARLTSQPVIDHTSVNHTLDSSPETFPLNRTLYADFSHDNDMAAIFAALRLHDGYTKLPTNKRVSPTKTGGFSASWVVPFAARLYVEKMQCGGQDDEPNEELVRFILNDRVIPLVGCGADALGRCKLSKWVESMEFARTSGKWSQCFV